MALSTLAAFKINLGIEAGDTSQDDLLNQALGAADAALKRYCKRNLEASVLTEYYSGTGSRNLVLRQRPVNVFSLSSTTTANSTTVTTTTTNLVAGMPVSGTGIAAGTTVSTATGGTVTLSTAATASGTVTLLYGIEVRMDQTGYGGHGSSAFASTTVQTFGTDYILDLDESGTKSNSGMLRRIAGSTSVIMPEDSDYDYSSLWARQGPVWPAGTRNIKVVYYAGYATIPEDLESVCLMWAAKMADYAESGDAYNSESLGQYSYTSPIEMPGRPQDIGSIRQILDRYKELST